MDEFNGSLSMVVFCFHRLAIQTDENDALKEALSSTLKAKEEDLKFYQEMMDQTKKIFLQGLRQFRQNSAPSWIMSIKCCWLYIYCPDAASVIEIKYHTKKLKPNICSICWRETIKLNQRFGFGMEFSNLLLLPPVLFCGLSLFGFFFSTWCILVSINDKMFLQQKNRGLIALNRVSFFRDWALRVSIFRFLSP